MDYICAIYIITCMFSCHLIEVSASPSCIFFLCVFVVVVITMVVLVFGARCCIVSCCTWRSGKDTRNIVPFNFLSFHILLHVNSMLSFFPFGLLCSSFIFCFLVCHGGHASCSCSCYFVLHRKNQKGHKYVTLTIFFFSSLIFFSSGCHAQLHFPLVCFFLCQLFGMVIMVMWVLLIAMFDVAQGGARM
jgi:hypothetical protein